MPVQLSFDVTIAGAGPAGISAAIRLAQKNIPCLLIDGGNEQRGKICGDGLSGKAVSTLNRLNPAYTRELVQNEFITPSHAVRFYSPNLKMVEIGFQSPDPQLPPGIVCRRSDFDRFLLAKAREFPTVSFLPGTRITRAERIEDGYLLRDEKGELEVKTRLLLLATGNDRKLVRSILPGYPGIHSEGLGVRAYFENVTGSSEKHSIEIHFLKELLPWYFWIFPFRDGSANVGLAMLMPQARKCKTSLASRLLQTIRDYPYLAERFKGAGIIGRVEAHRLPYFTGRQSLSGDNLLLLGDAAHLIDPFTGEGISHAMISGIHAAETAEKCLEANRFSNSITSQYDLAVYQSLGPELELGLRLQQLARNRRLLNLVIGKASKNENVRKLLEEMLYSMNSKGKLSQPMFYLKLMLGI